MKAISSIFLAVVAIALTAQPARADPPVVSNGSGATPGRGFATLNGDLLSTGGATTTVYTYWGESDGGTNKPAWEQVITNGVRNVGLFSANTPSGLLYGQRYYYRTYASNTNGEAWAAATTNFVTLSPAMQATYLNYDCGGAKPTGPGVVGEPGDLWNQSTGNGGWKACSVSSLATLIDPGGATIPGAALTCARIGYSPPMNGNPGQWAGVGNGNGPTSRTAPFDFSLGYGWKESTLLWTLSGLSTETPYDVYVFWGYGALAGGSASVNGRPPRTFTYAARPTLPVDGRDYRLFPEVAATGGVIVVSAPGSDSNAGISGFQIVSMIPAPSIANSPASGYASTSAVLHATLACTQAVYDVYAYWNTVNGGTNASLWTNSAHVGSWTNVTATAVGHPVTGLISNDLYYFTFRAVNAAEDLWAKNVRHFPHREKDMLTFGLPGMPAVILGTNITWTVPYGADATALAPAYTLSDLALGNPASGSTHDFSSPLVYTVTAEDSSTRDYLVTITNAARPSDFYWAKPYPADGAWSSLYDWTNETGLAGAPLVGGGADYHLHFRFWNESYAVAQDLGDRFLLNRLSFDGGYWWATTVTVAGNSLTFTNNLGLPPQVIQNSGRDITISSRLNLGANLAIGGTGTGGVTLSGDVSGVGGLTKTQSGTLILSGAKSFAGGVTLGLPGSAQYPNVRMNNASSLGTGTLRSELTGGGISDGGVRISADLSSGAGVTNRIEIADGARIVVNTENAGTNIKLSGSISGSGGRLIKTGPATLTLTGSNTYSGLTTLSAGTLVVGNGLALQNSTLDYSNGTTIFAGGITNVTLGGLSGNKPIALANAAGEAIALTVGGNGDTTTFSGGLSGEGRLIKTGAGTLTLSGANTFTGDTSIGDGTLRFTSADGLAPATDLYVVRGTALRLDYDGAIHVHTFHINGSLRPAGRYDAHNLPEFISGTGALVVETGRVSAIVIR